MQDQAKKLANEHWNYVGELVKWGQDGIASLAPEQLIELIKFHYLSAFIHGYKHGVESIQDKINVVEDILTEYGEPGNYE